MMFMQFELKLRIIKAYRRTEHKTIVVHKTRVGGDYTYTDRDHTFLVHRSTALIFYWQYYYRLVEFL